VNQACLPATLISPRCILVVTTDVDLVILRIELLDREEIEAENVIMVLSFPVRLPNPVHEMAINWIMQYLGLRSSIPPHPPGTFIQDLKVSFIKYMR